MRRKGAVPCCWKCATSASRSERPGHSMAFRSRSRAGEVRALIGENGAGKSTLMKIFSGAIRPDSGSMNLSGAPYAPRGPRDALARGVAMIYQELALAPHLSVEANVMLGQERGAIGPDRSARASADRRRGARAARSSRTSGPRRGSIAWAWVPSSSSRWPGRWFRARRSSCSTSRRAAFPKGTPSGCSRSSTGCKKRGLGIIYISHFLEEVRRVAQTLHGAARRPGGRGRELCRHRNEVDHHA